MEALRAISLLKKLTNHPLLCLPKDEFTEWRVRTIPSGNKAAAAASSSQAPPPAEPAAAPAALPDGEDDIAPAEGDGDFLVHLRSMLPGAAEGAKGAAMLSCKLRVLSVLLP